MIVLLNRDPEPNESAVPVNSNVSVDIADTGGTGIDVAETQVYIEDVLVFDNGTFQPGWNGPESATSNPDTYTLRVVVDPIINLEPLTEISVRVVSDVLGGGEAIDDSYVFTTADTIAPILIRVEPKGVKIIEAEFDEPVKNVSASNSDDALNPENWIFKAVEVAHVVAVTVVAESVEKVSETTYQITTDIELSFGREYDLYAADIEDIAGNVTLAPNNRVRFTALTPQAPRGRKFNLINFYPAVSIRSDETHEFRDFVAALQDTVDVELHQIDTWLDIIDIDKAPEEGGFLDAILLDLGNPFNFPLEEIDKRRLGRVLIEIYRQKGTCIGIINAVRFFVHVGPAEDQPLELECDAYNTSDRWILGVSELDGEDLSGAGPGDTYLGPGTLYDINSFKMISPVSLTAAQRDRVTEIVEYMKPAWMHFRGIDEPAGPPAVPDHVELGLSQLDLNWELH